MLAEGGGKAEWVAEEVPCDHQLKGLVSSSETWFVTDMSIS